MHDPIRLRNILAISIVLASSSGPALRRGHHRSFYPSTILRRSGRCLSPFHARDGKRARDISVANARRSYIYIYPRLPLLPVPIRLRSSVARRNLQPWLLVSTRMMVQSEPVAEELAGPRGNGCVFVRKNVRWVRDGPLVLDEPARDLWQPSRKLRR